MQKCCWLQRERIIPLLQDMPRGNVPYIKNTEISQEDIGEFRQSYAEESDIVT